MRTHDSSFSQWVMGPSSIVDFSPLLTSLDLALGSMTSSTEGGTDLIPTSRARDKQLQYQPQTGSSSPRRLLRVEGSLSRDLIDLYYLRFHKTHPFLLPLRLLSTGKIGPYPARVETVMQYAGSLFDAHVSSQPYRTAAHHAITDHDAPRDGYMVQAMLLFAIILHAQNEEHLASQVLKSAIELALQLGMHRKSFAQQQCRGVPSLEESWRRTWWELSIVDTLMAAAHGGASNGLFRVGSDVPLPCEEATYSLHDVR